MATRIMITLEPDERKALYELSKMKLRDPRDQIRFVIRRELVQLGLLNETKNDCESETEASSPTQAMKIPDA